MGLPPVLKQCSGATRYEPKELTERLGASNVGMEQGRPAQLRAGGTPWAPFAHNQRPTLSASVLPLSEN
jgi:hypothetical protein